MPVYKRSGSSNWLVEFVIDGKRFRRSSGTPVKRIAVALERKWHQEVIEGKHRIKAPTRLTLGEAIDRYWKMVISLKGSRERTKYAEKCSLAVVRARFGGSTPLDQITAETISDWKEALLEEGKAPATVNRYLASLRAILNRAQKEWHALRIVPPFSLLPLDNRRSCILSREDEKRVIAACANHLKPLAICLVDTGLRLSEALDLNAGDIVFPPNETPFLIVQRSKNGEARSVPLTERCQQVFKGLISGDCPKDAPIFTYRNGYRGKVVRFRHPFGAWKAALRRSGLSPEMRLHDLRHTFASRLVAAGVPLFDVAKLLGHKSLSMTMRYAHLSPITLQSAIKRLEACP